MASANPVEYQIKSLSEKIRKNEASIQDYLAYEDVLESYGYSEQRVRERMNEAGYQDYESFIEARKRAETLDQKRKTEVFVLGGLLGLGLGLILAGVFSND